jgi:uncharacterized protein YbaR (Trm112 family)
MDGKISRYESGDEMVLKELLNILRCPSCAKKNKGKLILYKESWLICADCGRKYPIVEDIPVMLTKEGDKWKSTPKTDLPLPPPRPD